MALAEAAVQAIPASLSNLEDNVAALEQSMERMLHKLFLGGAKENLALHIPNTSNVTYKRVDVEFT